MDYLGKDLDKAFGEGGKSLVDCLLSRWRFSKVMKWVPQDAVVLDVGCGYNGDFLARIAGYIREGVGVDQSVTLNAPCANVRLVSSRVSDCLEFKDEKFDVVVSLALIEHLIRPDIFLSECHRVLKTRGRLLITTPSKRAKPLLEFLAFRLGVINGKEIADHKRYFNRSELRNALALADFPMESILVSHFQCGFNLLAVAQKA